MKKTLKGLFAGLAIAAAPALADAPYEGAIPGERGVHRRPAPAVTQDTATQSAPNPLLVPSAVAPQAQPSVQPETQHHQAGYQIIPVGGRLAPCAPLAAQFGINWTHDEGRGFQQDGVVGCEYKAIPGAHGAPAAMPVGIYNLTRGDNAATFARMIDQASNRHTIAPLSPQEQQQLQRGGISRHGLPYNHNPALPLPPVGINGYVPNHGTPQINLHFRYPR